MSLSSSPLPLVAFVAFVTPALGAALGCASSSEIAPFESDPAPREQTGGGSLGGASGAPAPAGDGCSEAAKLVYVVSDANELFSFAPDKVTFTKVGTLYCPSNGATPNSMAVDRDGTAWVNFSSGAIFKVNTSDASCEATTFQPGQHGFTRFGMAFASNGTGSSDETLYVVGIDGLSTGRGLAKIDLTTMQLTPIGDFSGVLRGQGAELTGTGSGELYGFFTTQPNATLAQIDTIGGATSADRDLAGVSTGTAWAFSFWGGDFWFYTSAGPGVPSRVVRLETSAQGEMKVGTPNAGFRIVGAGVSTCAPTAPPR